MTGCTLCGLPTPDPAVTADGVEGAFCCRGCLEVARAVPDPSAVDPERDDLDAALGDGGVATGGEAAPAAAGGAANRIAGETAAADERGPGGDEPTPEDAETAHLAVDGLHCSACEAFVAATATGSEGVYDATVNYATDTATVVYDPDRLDEADLPGVIDRLGYSARLPDEDAGGSDVWDGRRIVAGSVLGMLVMLAYGRVLYRASLDLAPGMELGVLVATLVLGMAYCAVSLLLATDAVRAAAGLIGLQSAAFVAILWGDAAPVGATVAGVAALTTVVVGYTGYPYLRGAYVSLRAGRPNMDLLVALAVLAAYGYSLLAALAGSTEVYFDVAVMIVLVVTLGNTLEARVKERATSGLSAFADTRVEEARRRRPDGTTETVPVEDLEPGDEVVVNAGERVPVDGEVAAGTAAVDESLLTGEALPDTKRPADEVTGGTVVTDDRLVVAVADDADSTLDRLVDSLWEIRSSRTGVQRFADRLAAVFVPLIALLAALTGGYYLWAGAPVSAAVLTAVAVLVVSCPCALGLATPLAVAAGVRSLLDAGVVVTDVSLFERVEDVSVVAFDKTGTLTAGEMAVEDVVAEGADPAEVRSLAAAVEQFSEHPVAGAVTGAADPPAAEVTDFENRARGVAGTVDDRRVRVGHPDLFDDWAVPDRLAAAASDAGEGAVPTVVGWDGVARGVLQVTDRPRDGWADVVEAVAGPDREVVVLTGDDPAGARPFDDHPAVDEVLAEVPPDGKAAAVERLRERGPVAMVGDGSNDAPALAAADLGIAMASGTDLAADAADAVVVGGDLSAVPRLFALAGRTRGRVRENLGWALTYNAVAVPLAVSGALNPLFAAVAMAGSSLVVVGNSARPLDGGWLSGLRSGTGAAD